MATCALDSTNTYNDSSKDTKTHLFRECDTVSTDSGVQWDELKYEQTDEGRRRTASSEDSGVSSGSDGSNDSEKPLLGIEDTRNDFIIQTISKHTAENTFGDILLSEKENNVHPTQDPEMPTIFKQPNENSSDDKRFWIKVLVIFSILDVLLFVTILVVKFGLGLPCLGISSRPHQSRSEQCLNCMDVYLTTDDRDENIYNFIQREGGAVCCSSNQTHLIQKYVLKRYRSDEAKASLKRGYPKRTALHVGLDLNDTNSIIDGVNQRLKWTRRDSLISGDLSLSADRSHIQIGRTGLYFVSPMIVFDDTKKDIGGSNLDPMLLQVYRVREKVDLLLLENKVTHCANSDTKCNIPSSAQGVFKFENGDNIVVKVTKPCRLVLEDKLNHFDMYLI